MLASHEFQGVPFWFIGEIKQRSSEVKREQNLEEKYWTPTEIPRILPRRHSWKEFPFLEKTNPIPAKTSTAKKKKKKGQNSHFKL